MMRDDPHGAALLSEARRQLTEKLLPPLTGEMRYTALLIAHAMAIVERELEAGDSPLVETAAALSKLMGKEGRLPELTAELAADLRAGRRGGDEDCYAVLRRAVLLRLAESNPKALPAGEGD